MECQDPEPGWIYVVSDGFSNVYKCGMSITMRTRAEMEKFLVSKYRFAYPTVFVHHIVSSSNARFGLKKLLADLDDHHVTREFFMVDDISTIVDAMDNLVLA
jgi:hypothetical protein